jgi:hypothetical protein
MQWLDARAENKLALAEFYRGRFRAEFLPAFKIWSEKRLNQETTPFLETSYILSRQDEGNRLEAQSNQAYDDGRKANDISDRYVLNTVIFALVILFASAIQQFEKRGVKLILLGVALFMTAVGFGLLIRQPAL